MSTEGTKSETTPKPESEEKEKEKKAVVDTFFDVLTAEAARSLGVFARWLDALAKRVHEVATKLETKPTTTTKVEEAAPAK